MVHWGSSGLRGVSGKSIMSAMSPRREKPRSPGLPSVDSGKVAFLEPRRDATRYEYATNTSPCFFDLFNYDVKYQPEG